MYCFIQFSIIEKGRIKQLLRKSHHFSFQIMAVIMSNLEDKRNFNVCVCLCVCVFISFHHKGFSRLNKTINVIPEFRSAMLC